MTVLKKINTVFVEKIIQPGTTEEFFTIDLNTSDAFDWDIKTTMLSTEARGVVKVSSLHNDNTIVSTTYAILGVMFNTDVDVFVSADYRCVLTVTNNESSLIRCAIKLKTF